MTGHPATQVHPLDNPVRSSLAGPHARFALRRGAVLRYPADVCPFVGMPDQPGAPDWDDLAALAGPGTRVAMAGVRVPPPGDWEFTPLGEGVQLVDAGVDVADGHQADGEVIRLGAGDVAEMLELTRRTAPGP
ncbi:MAG TPA: GNAT family N-acetyltransferase, partial [Streptosporangiaceae bacterium]|nr:GNAT family N-acetyltransferase [Streptosporangiaceae bacterium]